jgi:fatty acid amide hydrolase 2
MIHPLRASATQIAQAIARGELSSREVVEVHIRAIESVNPSLNALVADRFDLARSEADEADLAVREGRELPPLHGVPFTVKEAFAVKGMPNTSGCVKRKHIVASEDATAVSRLMAAGAIPLGVSNLSELCMWMESQNEVYGRTSNPYDLKRIAGGSSGGEGALIGAGASPFGLGSDIGGSIRLPAFFNGVFGHKPSGGLVPGTGQFPFPTTPASCRFLGTGPLCRKAEDLYTLLKILAGPDGKDPGCSDTMTLKDPSCVDLGSLRVLNIPTNGYSAPSRSLASAQQRVVKHLARLGASVDTRTLPVLKQSFLIWSAALSEENTESWATQMGNGTPINPFVELLKWAWRKPDHTAIASLLAMAEKATSNSPAFQRHFANKGRVLREQLIEELGEDGVLLYPSFTRTAPRHRWPLVRQMIMQPDYQYTAILNVCELAVTQVPLGLDRRGLPLGIQVAAAPGHDHLTLAVALELQAAFGGWQPPAQFPLDESID